MSATPKTWDVFISYSTKDSAIIQEIVSDLKRRRITYWLDEEQIHPGDGILETIERGLRDSRAIMPCFSNNQLESGWSKAEYNAILNQVLSGKAAQRIYPLLLDDVAEEKLSLFFRNIKCTRYIDTNNYTKLIGTLERQTHKEFQQQDGSQSNDLVFDQITELPDKQEQVRTLIPQVIHNQYLPERRVSMGKALQNLFMVMASQVPMMGVAVAWWTGVLEHPVVAAGLVVGYEAGVIAWKQLGKPVWDEVWEQELKPQAVKGLATWMNVTIRHLVSRFQPRYLQQLIYDQRVFPMRGLLTFSQGALEVEQVFVELSIAPSHAMQVSTNPLGVKTVAGSQPVWEFLRRITRRKATALAILGPPGCGKTTLLKHLALTFAARKHRAYRMGAAIPILLSLREHVSAIVEEGISLGEAAQRYFADPLRYPELNPPLYWFARQLRNGRCIVLLDGLDEVIDMQQRLKIIDWVERQIRTYPRCKFLLTARPQGYRDSPLSQAYVLEVLPFTPEQVERFIHNWYLATKLIAYGKDDRGVRQDALREARDLFQRLQDLPRLKELTVNPLLLTMIANVHNYRGALPEKRVDLYAEICDVLLGHWQRGKGLGERLTAAQRRVALQPLAEAMMRQNLREIRTHDALAVMREHLLRIGIHEEDIPLFLSDVQANCGVLVEQEAEVWAFAHLTFQEYLCAAHWKASGKALQWEFPQWQSLIAESWWHETLLLYAAQQDATPLVKACLQINSPSALRLAANMSREALQLESSLRETIAVSLKTLIIQLRPEPRTVSTEEFKEVFQLDDEWRPLAYIQNEYEDQGEVIIDHATGLMWQKSGSQEYLPYQAAQDYIIQLNQQRFAGHSDWRLPTIPELMSLLEPEKQANELYINPRFDARQWWCWSADRVLESSEQSDSRQGGLLAWFQGLRGRGRRGSSGSAWDVTFDRGSVYWHYFDLVSSVRAVRSRQ